MANIEIIKTTIKTLQKRISCKFTQNVLDDILRKKCGFQDVSVSDIKIGAETKKGDSFLSTVTRFSVDFTYINESGKKIKETAHIIVKALLNNVARRKTFRSAEFFANEIRFYTLVWPTLDAFQRSKNPQELFVEIPNCLATYCDGIHDFVALEDLSYKGYRSAEKSLGLDIDHINLIMRIFARFHALSYAYKMQNPSGFENIDKNQAKETYFGEQHRSWYEEFHEVIKDIVRDAVEEELPEQYSAKLNEVFSKDMFGAAVADCARRGTLTTLQHGDSWIPNFLIHYDESGKPKDTVMIDFQLARCSSLALDLQFFFYACTDDTFLNNRYKETLDYYCKEFNAFAKNLGTEVHLTKEQLWAEFKEIGSYTVAMTIEAIVVALLDAKDIPEMDIEGDEAKPLAALWVLKPIKIKEKRIRVANFIKNVIDNGFI